jgi:hypothetical protein
MIRQTQPAMLRAVFLKHYAALVESGQPIPDDLQTYILTGIRRASRGEEPWPVTTGRGASVEYAELLATAVYVKWRLSNYKETDLDTFDMEDPDPRLLKNLAALHETTEKTIRNRLEQATDYVFELPAWAHEPLVAAITSSALEKLRELDWPSAADMQKIIKKTSPAS